MATTNRVTSPERLARFVAVYAEQLPIAIAKYPVDYCYPVTEAPTVAEKMAKAFASGSYNHDGQAIRLTCKALGFKHTRTAIESFLCGL